MCKCDDETLFEQRSESLTVKHTNLPVLSKLLIIRKQLISRMEITGSLG